MDKNDSDSLLVHLRKIFCVNKLTKFKEIDKCKIYVFDASPTHKKEIF